MCFEFKLFVNVFVFGRENKKRKRKKEQEFYRSEPNFPYENKA
jgi:hypothetical protein